MQRVLLLSICIILWLGSRAQSRWSVELQGAGVYNIPVPLTIHQQGYEVRKLTARYTTEPFTPPVYYDLRISHWKGERSWEAEFIHHKLYLQNTDQEIQKFNISHGFNFLFVNRGFYRSSFCYRLGAGVVIAHPESQIRGLSFGSSSKDNDWGYYLSGPALQGSVNKPFYIGQRFFINAEAKTTLAHAWVKVAQGNARVTHLAFHLLLGIGLDFKKQ